MTSSENIKTSFPDKYGIKDNLRNGQSKSGNFLELTIDSYKILSSILNEELTVKESLQHNQNLSIFTHQILAANKIKNEFGGNAILSDEVGLGKTIEAGIIIKEFLVTGLAQKILILTPPSLLTQWQDEMNSKFNLDFISQKTDNRFRDVFSHDLLIMSHSSAVFPTFSKALESIPWDLVIVDEAHSMKNSETKKHKLVRNLTKKFLLLLTATPVQNNLLELYNLVDLLQPGLLGTWKQFQERYTIDRQSRKLNSIFKDELQTLLSEVIIRTTRNEVKEITFTERLPNTEILKPSGEEKLLYSKITDAIRDAYEADDGSNFLALMTYQRLAASSTMSAKGAIKRMLQNKIISNDKYEEMISISNKI